VLEAEQARDRGVLLVIDLSTRSAGISSVMGHKEAEILPWLAQAIRQAIRNEDLLAHVDGYRFAALLPGAPQHLGASISQRILDSVDNTIFMTADGMTRLGVTVGGAVFEAADRRDAIGDALSNLGLARASGAPAIVQ
jgi:GGDEF domain-containing protein